MNMRPLHPNYHIVYNEKENWFDFSVFNKSILGSVIVARVGKEKAIALDMKFEVREDGFGPYEQWTIEYGPAEKKKGSFTGIIKAYPYFIVFETINHHEIKGKKNKHPYGNPYISFPSFEGEYFEGNCTCLSYKRQAPFNYPIQWKGRVIDSLREGKNSPLIITNMAYETVVLSPMTHFLHGTVSINKYPEQVRCGIPRSVERIEKETSFKTLMVIDTGVNKTMNLWGALLRQEHRVEPIGLREDVLLKYISYWTNAGSAYWYRSIHKTSYENTLKKLVAHHESIGLHFGSYQLDSWWYHKDGDHYTSSIVEWEPKEETTGKNFNSMVTAMARAKTIPMFQKDKLSYVQSILKKPIGCHFKQISKDAIYVNDNREDFLIDHFAMPKNKSVAKDLFKRLFNHPRWALSYVIHDWLSFMNERHAGFRSIQMSEDYFEGLDEACLETPSSNNESGHLSLQFCMTQPHMTLNSVKMQSVTSIRSTSDSNSFFVEGPKRWRWHLYASKMIQALGKYAFYDNRRSGKSSYILPNKYAKFEMIWLGLSCGPIGIGDQLGKENMSLIKKVIKSDGEIIKPDVPAVPLDACYIYNPYDVSSKKGVTVFSYSQMSSNTQDYKVLYLLSFNMNPIRKKVTTTYALKETHHTKAGSYVVYDYFSMTLQVCNEQDLKTYSMKGRKIYYHIGAPIVHGFAYIGDVSKHVCASNQLVEHIDIGPNSVTIDISYIRQPQQSQWVCYSQHKPQRITSDLTEISYEFKEGKLVFDLKNVDLIKDLNKVRIRIEYTAK
ncbi:hypothetical protein [Petrocella atlantisensis]|nr:hypothetical protein [Petrocella atlantisensis]